MFLILYKESERLFLVNSYNLNIVSQNPNIYKASFKGENQSVVSSPDKRKEFKQQRELASKECAYATKATALAQVLTGNNLKYSTTPEDYIKDLIKQGKIQDKDFKIQKEDLGDSNCKFTSIKEFNKSGEIIKETDFCRDNKYSDSWNAQYFINAKYNCPYKGIFYHQDGSVEMSNYDVVQQAIVDSYAYRSDGSLEYYHDFKDNKGKHISKEGKVTKFDLEDEKGNLIKREFDDNGSLIFEDK